MRTKQENDDLDEMALLRESEGRLTRLNALGDGGADVVDAVAAVYGPGAVRVNTGRLSSERPALIDRMQNFPGEPRPAPVGSTPDTRDEDEREADRVAWRRMIATWNSRLFRPSSAYAATVDDIYNATTGQPVLYGVKLLDARAPRAWPSPAPAAPPDASDDPQTTPDPSVASEALTEATATGRDTFGHVRRPGDHRPRLWQKSEGERAMDMWDEAHRYGLAAIGVPAPGFQAKIISPVCDACGDDPDEWPCVNCHRGGDR